MPPSKCWIDLTTRDFETLDPDTVAVFPLTAVEQHGPHLPVSTDLALAEGYVKRVIDRVRPDFPVLFLPPAAIGKSDEHIRFAGTLTHTPETLIAAWTEIGLGIARAGVRKLILIHSHGGNSEVMGIVARKLKLEADMFVVTTSWLRFGQPDSLYSDAERKFGIHAGDIETSMMLALDAPGVEMKHAEDFEPTSVAMDQNYEHLRATGPASYAWRIDDLHPSGAAGNAAAATPEKGEASLDYAVEGFIQLLEDVHRFPLTNLGDA
ncbi:MAG: creatininase family protein [Pseudomonadota bacterium]